MHWHFIFKYVSDAQVSIYKNTGVELSFMEVVSAFPVGTREEKGESVKLLIVTVNKIEQEVKYCTFKIKHASKQTLISTKSSPLILKNHFKTAAFCITEVNVKYTTTIFTEIKAGF